MNTTHQHQIVELRGYVWQIEPTADAPPAQEAEHDADGWPICERIDYRFHALDVEPTDAEYLADEGTYGHLVLTDGPDEPNLPAGWTAEPVNLDDDWRYIDSSGCYTAVKIASIGTTKHADGTSHDEALIALRIR